MAEPEKLTQSEGLADLKPKNDFGTEEEVNG